LFSKGGWQGFLSRRSVWASLSDKSIVRAELIQQPLPILASQRLLQLQKELRTSLGSKRRYFWFCVTSGPGDAVSQTKVKHQNEHRAALLPL